MGIHESQSLLWERMVGLSLPFCTYLLPKLREAFPGALPANKDAQDLYTAINKVICVWMCVFVVFGGTGTQIRTHAHAQKYTQIHTCTPPPTLPQVKEPSFIRVEADEVSYPLHIILRYELERGLLKGDIQVEDLPRLWNEKMVQYFGQAPPSDAQGVLQDVHWSMVWRKGGVAGNMCGVCARCTCAVVRMHPLSHIPHRAPLVISPHTRWVQWQQCRYLMPPARTSPTSQMTLQLGNSPHCVSGSTRKCMPWVVCQQVGMHCSSWRLVPHCNQSCTCSTSHPNTSTFTNLSSECFVCKQLLLLC